MEKMDDQQFAIVKAACKAQWETMDNTYGYVDEKLSTVNRLTNVGDNWAYLIAMFDAPKRLNLLQLMDSVVSIIEPVIIESVKGYRDGSVGLSR